MDIVVQYFRCANARCMYQYSIDNGVIGNSGFGMFRHDAP